jgi:hypothetical protein
MRTPFSAFVSLLLTIAAVIAGIVVLFALLTSTDLGPAEGCENPDTDEVRTVEISDALAAEFEQAWNDANAGVAGGQPEVSFSLTEAQVSSRANRFLEDGDAPVKDVTVCFHSGSAEAHGKVETPTLAGLPLIGSVFEPDVKVAGTVDFNGERPSIQITELDAGALPGFIEDRIKDRIKDEVNGLLDDLALKNSYSLTFSEGQVQVTVRPK